MKSRLPLYLFLGVFTVACSGDAGARAENAEPAMEIDADPAATAALEDMRAGFVQHYNLHHASMAADYYVEDGLTLLANGTVNVGREAITANLEAVMALNPTLAVENHEQMVFGDVAVTRGEYSVDFAPEGADAMTVSGYFMSVANNVDGEWKLANLLSNYSAPPPEGTPMATPDEGPPPDLEGHAWADMTAAWATHFNLGHASMVADLYAEDAVTMWGDESMAEGRAAITAALEADMAEGSPQIELHDVMIRDLGDGWHVGTGWYDQTTEDGTESSGAYMVLTSTAADGSTVIHWDASNAPW